MSRKLTPLACRIAFAIDGVGSRRAAFALSPSGLNGSLLLLDTGIRLACRWRVRRQALRDRILPDLGALRVNDVTRDDLQDAVDRMLADGLDPSTVRNAMMPARAIFGRLVGRSDSGVTVNPTTGLQLPAVRGTRDRIADPAEAEQLLAALPDADRTLWATAMYAGLRRGELRALRVEDVDLAGAIHVRALLG